MAASADGETVEGSLNPGSSAAAVHPLTSQGQASVRQTLWQQAFETQPLGKGTHFGSIIFLHLMSFEAVLLYSVRCVVLTPLGLEKCFW